MNRVIIFDPSKSTLILNEVVNSMTDEEEDELWAECAAASLSLTVVEADLELTSVGYIINTIRDYDESKGS